MKIIVEDQPDFQSNKVVFRIELDPAESPSLLSRLVGVPEYPAPINTQPVPVRYATEGSLTYEDGRASGLEEGARGALHRVAEFIAAAGGATTSAWVRTCSDLGMQAEWPPAPLRGPLAAPEPSPQTSFSKELLEEFRGD